MTEAKFFAGRTGLGIRVAVIDSGVYGDHPHVGGITGGVAISAGARDHNDHVDRIGHGTAVAAAIREKAPDTQIFAVKVFDRSLTTHIETLVEAIDWAAQHEIRLANLSLGTANAEHEDALREAITRTAGQGLLVVSAYEDGGVRWLPGSLPKVVPVVLDWDCPRDEYRIDQSTDGRVLLRASGYPRPIPGVSPERNLKGPSFAVANMTGFIARALEAHPNANFEELISALSRHV